MTGHRDDPSLDAADTIPGRTRRAAVSEGAPPVALGEGGVEDDGSVAARYAPIASLGAGGMGEIRLCLDRRIGREVAMKVIHSDHGSFSDARQRFFREARVQGQLEHPAVVPVHDLGLGPDGPYFTMKRIRGLTLEDVIMALRDGDPDAQRAYSLRRLLTAMSTVCLAVAFAHSRGVLHRDLKPANVMLGAFGEVHVLDWGLAKIANTADIARPIVDAPEGDSGKTAVGAAMGTPGYMAPEQAAGAWELVDARADVYALGAMLFEVLTLLPLHAGRTFLELTSSTLKGADARARLRAPGRAVAPALEALCVKATALDPEDRFASARELADAIDAFLDGTLDDERRRAMAEQHAEAAAVAAATALSRGDEAARSAAMRQAGMALALAPAHPAALEALARLLLTPPAVMPEDARAEYEAHTRVVERSSALGPFYSYAGWLAFVPIVLLLGVRDATLFAIGIGAILAAMAGAYAAYKLDVGPRAKFGVYLLGSAAVMIASALLGPLIIVPNLAVTNALGFVLYGEREHRNAAIGFAGLCVALPFGAQLAGLVSPSYAFSVAGMTIVPRMAALPEGGTLALLFFASLALVLLPSVFAGRVRDEVVEAQRRAFLQSWNLRQLLPEGARKVAGE